MSQRNLRDRSAPVIEWDGDDPFDLLAELAAHYAADAGSILDLGFAGTGLADLPGFADESFDLVCARLGPGMEWLQSLGEIRRVMRDGATLVALATGESHRIEAQHIFGRGASLPTAQCLRFAVPQKLASAGFVLLSFSEYYATGYCPDIDSYARLLALDPVIPDFDPEKDAMYLREVARKLATDRGIRDTEHLALFVAARVPSPSAGED